LQVGQVGFKSDAAVYHVKNVEKDNDVLRQLKKSKREGIPNLPEEKQRRDDEEKKVKRIVAQEEKRRNKEDLDKQKEESRMRSYDLMMDSTLMQSNREVKGLEEYEEDFM
jgi:hypothetical protein